KPPASPPSSPSKPTGLSAKSTSPRSAPVSPPAARHSKANPRPRHRAQASRPLQPRSPSARRHARALSEPVGEMGRRTKSQFKTDFLDRKRAVLERVARQLYAPVFVILKRR